MQGRTLTSAWIETSCHVPQKGDKNCRTLTSAWIETMQDFTSCGLILVALSRVRGLKRFLDFL